MAGDSPVSTPRPKKFLDQARDVARYKQFSYRTEQCYVNWIRRFILFHDKRHPQEMGAEEVRAFLTHLAAERHVSASTQNQALGALLFLYRDVLRQELGALGELTPAKRPHRLPVVLTREEVRLLLAALDGPFGLMAGLVYGAGLRLMECCWLRVKDIDFGQGHGNRQAGQLPHAAAFLRHAPLGRRGGHQDRAGAAGARRRQHNDDLHPRPQPSRRRCSQPAGRVGLEVAAPGNGRAACALGRNLACPLTDTWDVYTLVP